MRRQRRLPEKELGCVGIIDLLNVAVIGCGDMGTKHATAWSARQDARVVAVCDIIDERCHKLAKKFNAGRYENGISAIGHEGVDVVSICTPAKFHKELAVRAANAGKHILCEKPMALALTQADEMIAAAEENGVCLLVSHQYRGLSRYKVLKRLIEEDVLGSPVYIRFMEMREVRPKLDMHRRHVSGGPIHDMSGHLFDLGRFLINDKAESVTATGNIFGRGKNRLATVEDLGVDTAEIQVRFQRGHCLSICIGWGLPEGTPGYSHEAFHGPKGVAYTSDAESDFRFLGDPSETLRVAVRDGNGLRSIKLESDFEGPDICIAELVSAIGNGDSSKLNGSAGRFALELILAALKSVELEKTVYLN